MSDEMKKLRDWEKEQNVMIQGDVVESNPLNIHQFELLKRERGFKVVDYNERTKFLKDNGYELNRTNYMSNELTAKGGK